jgi:hypothetical protein
MSPGGKLKPRAIVSIIVSDRDCVVLLLPSEINRTGVKYIQAINTF